MTSGVSRRPRAKCSYPERVSLAIVVADVLHLRIILSYPLVHLLPRELPRRRRVAGRAQTRHEKQQQLLLFRGRQHIRCGFNFRERARAKLCALHVSNHTCEPARLGVCKAYAIVAHSVDIK